MDLIYIILSVLLRLSPAVRKVSRVTKSTKRNGSSSARRKYGHLMDLAFWFPLVGWISVSVQDVPTARWLQWRVRSVYSFGVPTDFESDDRWKSESSRRSGETPPGHRRR